MEFLKFLEGIRAPFLDEVFSIVTRFGEETIFIVVGLFLFWCVDKKKGYYLLTVGFTGIILNQFLKLLFRIPRPWVRDPSFTIVESARAEATGYSFPSGHTQSAVGTFGSIGRMFRNVWLRVICVVLCLLVPLSRMYLGVHTPADVGVSFVIAVVLVFGLYPLIAACADCPRRMRWVLGALTALSVAFLVFVLVFPFPSDIDAYNYEHGVQNAYKMLGCMVGLWISYEFDMRYMKFETSAVWWVQILKLVGGMVPVLLVKSLLKSPLYALCGGNPVADGIRYFLLVLVAAGIWPLTFQFFTKIGTKKGTTPCVYEEKSV